MFPSTFLIKSTQNSSFGTAFCVGQDKKGIFLVTCSHVIDECGEDKLEIEGHTVQLLYKGNSKNVDLAILYLEKLIDTTYLPLYSKIMPVETHFSLDGFKPHKSGSYLQRPLHGYIHNISKVHSDNKTVKTYELIIEDDYIIRKGYSGSAIISNGVVVGVATDKNSNGKQAYAIPIIYLKEIWQKIPKGLFVDKIKLKDNFTQKVNHKLYRNSSTYSFLRKNFLIILIFIVSIIQFFIYDDRFSAIERLVDAGTESFTALFYVLIAVTVGSPLIVLSTLQNGLDIMELPLLATSITNSIILIVLIRNFFYWIRSKWFTK